VSRSAAGVTPRRYGEFLATTTRG